MSKFLLAIIVAVMLVLSGCSTPKYTTQIETTPPDVRGDMNDDGSSAEQADSNPVELPKSESEEVKPTKSEKLPKPAYPVEKINLSPAGEERQTYEEGTYKVGVDIPASTYLFFAYDNDALSSSVTVRDGDGSYAKIVASDTCFENLAIIAVKEGEYLESEGCFFEELAFYNFYADKVSESMGLDYIMSGTYLAGFTIKPGKYRLVPEEDRIGNITIYGDPYHKDAKFMDSFTEPSYVKIDSGEYLQVSGARIYPVDYKLTPSETPYTGE